MKVVLQRVKSANVSVEGKVVGSIGHGYLALLGVGAEDTKADVERIVKKIAGLRIFADSEDKINLSIADVSGELLVVSQFTLYADTKKGNRPSFINAAPPALAEELYEYFIEQAKGYISKVEHGVFGAHMMVSLDNDGPFTLILE